ncbi:putative DNA-binding domain-containing protein [Pseudomonas sp. NA-150]|uniref:HvfC/BufC family peptide modification chaperone n=1 Tax=Pseudomonas sp. NA-150 TaxID=3367525 RepID=UPI0037C4F32F
MKLPLSDFQNAFVGALYGVDSSALAALTEQPGFSVYRNTVLKGTTDALLANFPTVERLVGTDWFRAAASIHAHQTPPTDARLLYYGADFPAFLDTFEHAQDMPYLGNVARLDRLWNEVHSEAEDSDLDLSVFADFTPEKMSLIRLKPRPAARWVWFVDQPVYSIWSINREQRQMPEDLNWVGEGALLVRSTGQVEWQPLGAGGCAFLDACAAGLPLDHAAHHALEAEAELDFMALLTTLIQSGVFASSITLD